MRVRQPKHLAYLLACPLFGACLLTLVLTGENNLSFIETSALDASNVELAFQNILTGTSSNVFPLSFPTPHPPFTRIPHRDGGQQKDTYEIFLSEVYRIVSSKALDQGDAGQNSIGDRKPLELTNPTDADKAKSGCC